MIFPEKSMQICRDAVVTFGADNQLWVLFGEIGELQDKIADFKQGRCSIYHVAEEIADVIIMLVQLTIILACEEELNEALKYKLKRLRHKIKKVWGGSKHDN